MFATKAHSRVAEYGDFQTPPELAARICRLLTESTLAPATILEPTCGVGNLLFAARVAFPGALRAIGVDINPKHLDKAHQRAKRMEIQPPLELLAWDFFHADWQALLDACREPILVIGNPPWITNSQLSRLGGVNAPLKSNEQGLSGFEAISGKSNFDISEWMLIRLLDWLDGRNAALAMLCKTSVARKVMSHAWRSKLQVKSAEVHRIDSRAAFGVSVDACLLVVSLTPGEYCDICSLHPSLSDGGLVSAFGYRNGFLIANTDCFDRWSHLLGQERRRWRSGIKHDCSGVMELRRTGDRYLNGLHEEADLEDEFLYPLLKSSDLARGRLSHPAKRMLVTQKRIGDDTGAIEHTAPRTWAYLQSHADRLDARGSAVYSRQPRFAVFGVGDYSFAPWKVAIPGLYGSLDFRVVPPVEGKPVVLDDTCYFLACDTEEEATYLASLLNSTATREFYSAFVFPDSKRPITVDILRRLDLLAVARAVGSESRLQAFLDCRGEMPAGKIQRASQEALFSI